MWPSASWSRLSLGGPTESGGSPKLDTRICEIDSNRLGSFERGFIEYTEVAKTLSKPRTEWIDVGWISWMDKLDKFGHFHWRGIFETCAQTKIGENYELSIFKNFKFKNLNRIYIEAESLSESLSHRNSIHHFIRDSRVYSRVYWRQLGGSPLRIECARFHSGGTSWRVVSNFDGCSDLQKVSTFRSVVWPCFHLLRHVLACFRPALGQFSDEFSDEQQQNYHAPDKISSNRSIVSSKRESQRNGRQRVRAMRESKGYHRVTAIRE